MHSEIFQLASAQAAPSPGDGNDTFAIAGDVVAAGKPLPRPATPSFDLLLAEASTYTQKSSNYRVDITDDATAGINTRSQLAVQPVLKSDNRVALSTAHNTVTATVLSASIRAEPVADVATALSAAYAADRQVNLPPPDTAPLQGHIPRMVTPSDLRLPNNELAAPAGVMVAVADSAVEAAIDVESIASSKSATPASAVVAGRFATGAGDAMHPEPISRALTSSRVVPYPDSVPRVSSFVDGAVAQTIGSPDSPQRNVIAQPGRGNVAGPGANLTTANLTTESIGQIPRVGDLSGNGESRVVGSAQSGHGLGVSTRLQASVAVPTLPTGPTPMTNLAKAYDANPVMNKSNLQRPAAVLSVPANVLARMQSTTPAGNVSLPNASVKAATSVPEKVRSGSLPLSPPQTIAGAGTREPLPQSDVVRATVVANAGIASGSAENVILQQSNAKTTHFQEPGRFATAPLTTAKMGSKPASADPRLQVQVQAGQLPLAMDVAPDDLPALSVAPVAPGVQTTSLDAASTLSLRTSPVFSAGTVETLGQALAGLLVQRSGNTRMRISSAAMGAVDVTLARQSNQLSIQFHAANVAVAGAIEATLPVLQQQLVQQISQQPDRFNSVTVELKVDAGTSDSDTFDNRNDSSSRGSQNRDPGELEKSALQYADGMTSAAAESKPGLSVDIQRRELSLLQSLTGTERSDVARSWSAPGQLLQIDTYA